MGKSVFALVIDCKICKYWTKTIFFFLLLSVESNQSSGDFNLKSSLTLLLGSLTVKKLVQFCVTQIPRTPRQRLVCRLRLVVSDAETKYIAGILFPCIQSSSGLSPSSRFLLVNSLVADHIFDSLSGDSSLFRSIVVVFCLVHAPEFRSWIFRIPFS